MSEELQQAAPVVEPVVSQNDTPTQPTQEAGDPYESQAREQGWKPKEEYEGDEFEYGINPSTGYMHVMKHTQNIKNIDIAKIVGAYAIVNFNDGRSDLTVMTMDQIRKAWNQGATKGASPAHQNFTDEMAKKTVINRACKTPINSSTDAFLMEDEYEAKETKTEDVAHEIIEDTASQEITFELQQPQENPAITPSPDF